MYLATVAALEEVGRDEPRKSIRFERIRDLRGSAKFLRREEFMPLADDARAHFSDARWNQLKTDLSFLRNKTMDNNWWSGVVLDSGFNPPPSYAVMSSLVSNTIPFNEATWRLVGGLDFLLLGIGVAAIVFAIGLVPGLFTLVIMGNTPITTYNWTGGSFLRQLWVFFLMIGVAQLARRRWTGAGVALGACVASVFFPMFFLFGALAPLGYRYFRGRSPTPFLRVAVAAAATVVVLIGLSLARFGSQPWSEWNTRISAHSRSFFDNHIGIKKITTFAPEVAPQAFGAGDNVYPEWNGALVARSKRGQVIDIALALLLSALVVGGGLRQRPAESALVVGSGLLVLWTMPAGYYTIYVGTFAAFVCANRFTKRARLRFAVVCLALFLAIFLQHYEPDRILMSVTLSVGWLTCIFILSALSWIERPPIAQTVAESRRTVKYFFWATAALFVTGAVIRDWPHDARFLPKQELRGGRVADVLDVGPEIKGHEQDEAEHGMDIGEPLRVDRKYFDPYGYRVQDQCGILRGPESVPPNGHTLKFDFAPLHRAGRIIVRTDSFYKGALMTKINGQPVAQAPLDPRQTLFVYLQIPIPTELADGQPLHVEQTTDAKDVGIFTEWLVED
jgi:hypothetical protein